MSIKLRPVVRAFAEQMEIALRHNDHKEGWGKCSSQYLFARLRAEVNELSAASRGNQKILEAADVGNFAMMIADANGMNPVPDREDHTSAAATLAAVRALLETE